MPRPDSARPATCTTCVDSRRTPSRLRAAFPDPWLRLYSLKANGLPALISRLPGSGFGATVVSAGELALARRAGFAPATIALEGIGKGVAELRAAVAAVAAGEPLLWVSLESADEARALSARAERAGVRLDVLVRINPQVQPETHGGLAVGAPASKFGILADELPELIDAGGGPDGPLRWRGIHLHIGSQLGAVDAWRSAVRVGLRLLSLQRAALPDFDTLDVGSGFAVDYGVDGSAPGPEVFAEAAADEVSALPADARPQRLAIEPGRAVVAASGWLIGRVLHVRERSGPEGPTRLVVLDTGMTELIRPALYGAEHPMVALTSLGGHGPTGRRVGPGARRRADLRIDRPTGCRTAAAAGPGRPRGHRRRGRVRLIDGLDLQRPAATAGDRLGWRAAQLAPSQGPSRVPAIRAATATRRPDRTPCQSDESGDDAKRSRSPRRVPFPGDFQSRRQHPRQRAR